MNQKPTIKSKTSTLPKDTLESLRESYSSSFDQILGNYEPKFNQESSYSEEKKFASAQRKKEFKLFNYQEYYEKELLKKQVKELTELIKKEIEAIKKADTTLLQQVADIQKIAVEQLPEKPGIYHIRFLEIVLRILQSLKAKIGESRTWLQALISRKKKRGSLFLARSKKQGTQYSLSQELQTARAVQ